MAAKKAWRRAKAEEVANDIINVKAQCVKMAMKYHQKRNIK